MSQIDTTACMWEVDDGARHIGLVHKNVDGTHTGYVFGGGGMDGSEPYATKGEAVSWVVARDAVWQGIR